MKNARLLGVAWLLLMLIAALDRCAAQEAYFFRIVSTQETSIVSMDCQGVLTWNNAVSNAPCRIEGTRSLHGPWKTNLICWQFERTNLLARARVPLYAAAGEILVAFEDTVSVQQANSLIQSNGLIWESHFPTTFRWWVKVTSGLPSDYIPLLEASDIVLWAQQRGKPDGEPGADYLLVQFNTLATQEAAEQLIGSFPGLQLDTLLVSLKWGLVYVPAGTEQNWIQLFESNPLVRYAELNAIVTTY